MIGFFGSVVGHGAISNPTNDCPRHIPVDSTTKLARHLNITVLLKDEAGKGNFFQRRVGQFTVTQRYLRYYERRNTVTQSFVRRPMQKDEPSPKSP
jgi:hypothetical protein